MKYIFTLSFVLAFFIANAQNQKNFWYFGDKAGVNFNSGTAIPVLDGELEAYEGCSSISDSLGNLLFYTNGGPFLSFAGGVWNRNHVLMPNGDLSNASSCNSSSQAALIVPDPRNQYRYYIFTTDCQENQMAGGLRYNTVDMSLDSGLGDVIEKNLPLAPAVTESLIGIRHSNGKDYWVVVSVLNSSNFLAYLINENGIQAPVLTTIGPYTPQQVGQMCASPDGSRIGFAATWDTYLFNFDNSTGVLSNFISLGVESYGCAFSPDNQVFYANKLTSTRPVYQFDLNAANIPGSVVIVGNNNTGAGNMMLGPDGKIYSGTQSGFLGVVNNPNVLGAGCNYVHNGLYLGSRTCNYGLPNFVNQFINTWCDNYDTLNVTSLITYTSPSGNYTWNTSGVYFDTLANSNGCDSIIIVNLTIEFTGVNDLFFENNFTIYPNPSDGNFKIDFQNSNSLQSHLLRVYDIYGNIVMEQTMKINSSNDLFIDVPSGIYFVSVKSENVTSIQKLNVVRNKE